MKFRENIFCESLIHFLTWICCHIGHTWHIVYSAVFCETQFWILIERFPSPLRVWICVFLSFSTVCFQRHSQIGCNCLIFKNVGSDDSCRGKCTIKLVTFVLTFPYCAFSNVSSIGLYERMHSHIGCIYVMFLHCVFSNVSSNILRVKFQSYTRHTCLTSF